MSGLQGLRETRADEVVSYLLRRLHEMRPSVAFGRYAHICHTLHLVEQEEGVGVQAIHEEAGLPITPNRLQQVLHKMESMGLVNNLHHQPVTGWGNRASRARWVLTKEGLTLALQWQYEAALSLEAALEVPR